MKQMLITAVVIIVLAGTSCSTITPVQRSPHDEVTIIHVECANQRQVHSTVVLLLRQERVSDWTFRDLGGFEEIEARYAVIHPVKAERIKEQLTQISGVVTVEIKKDGMPVRNVR